MEPSTGAEDRYEGARNLIEGFAELLDRPVEAADVATAILSHVRTDLLFAEDMDDDEKFITFAVLQEAADNDPLLVVAHIIEASAHIQTAWGPLYNGARILATLQAAQ